MKEKKIINYLQIVKMYRRALLLYRNDNQPNLPSLINNAYIMLFGQLITSSTNLFDTVEDTYHMGQKKNNALLAAADLQPPINA